MGDKEKRKAVKKALSTKNTVTILGLTVPQISIIDNLYEAVIHNAMDAFFITDFEGNILEVNDALCRMEGYSRDELLSMRLQDLDTELIENPQKLIQVNQEFVNEYIESNGGKNSLYIEKKHRRKDGQIINVEISYHYLGTDIGLFFHFNRDVTERRQAEEKLRESKEFVENIIASMRDGFSIIDTQGVSIEVNDSLCKMTGFTREELIGGKPPYHYWPEEEYENIQLYFDKTLSLGQEFKDRELIFKRKNGERFPVILSPSCLKDSDGKIINFFCTIKDITEQKRLRAEQFLRKETEKQLKQRMEFTRALAHELKTPLTPLLATSDILLTEAVGEPVLSYAKNINAGARELNRRIGDLLDLARGEVGAIELELKRTDLLPIIKDVIEYIKPEASKSGLSINMDIDSHLPRVLVDKQRVRQIILNLLDNSIKYTRCGGSINISAYKNNGFIITTVTDTGYGIARKDKDSLFKPYTHLDGRGSKYRGLGLGLALSKMFVELHGGNIWLEGGDNKGSSFSFTLPLYGNRRTKSEKVQK